MNERRTVRRYALSLPVQIRIPSSEETAPHKGQTRDVSTRGVYFLIDREIEPGAEFDFTLMLPAEVTRGTDVLVRAHGRVIRVDKRDSEAPPTVGVAAAIERYDIVNNIAET
jgi:hypothetical protein